MKKFMLIVSVLALFLAVNTLPVGMAAKSTGITVGFVAGDMSADSNAAAYKSFEAFAKKNGWKINLIDCRGEQSSKMSSNIINLVSYGVNAIVVCSGEASIIQEGVVAAEKAKIPVFLEDTENIRNTIVNATSSQQAMGTALAEQAVKKLRSNNPAKKTKNILIIGNMDLLVHRQRIEAYKEVLESPKNKDMHIVGVEAINGADWANSSYNIARTYIIKYGDELDAILCTWDGLGWGVSRAILDAGYNKKQIFTMGIDGSAKSYDLIRKGDPLVGVISQDFGGWSTAIGSAIKKVVVEKKDPKKVIPESRTIYVPFQWVDESNVPAPGKSVKYKKYNGI
jgi:ABC-type sugar transport system substrate-binding protein